MKRLSNILTYILLFAVLNLIWFIIKDYNQFKGLGVKNDRIKALEQSVFIYLILYILALFLSVFLNKRKKYILNAIISGLMAICYIAAIILMFR